MCFQPIFIQILEVVLAWLKFNWESRQTQAIDLLKKIRLGLVPRDELVKLLEDPEIGGVEECKKLIEDVLGVQNVEWSWSEKPLSEKYPQWFATRNTITVSINCCKNAARLYLH